ncbi:MAG TPA: hypothetical protein VGB22_00950 [candidate division Zixibacteria bacterium]
MRLSDTMSGRLVGLLILVALFAGYATCVICDAEDCCDEARCDEICACHCACSFCVVPLLDVRVNSLMCLGEIAESSSDVSVQCDPQGLFRPPRSS